MAIDKTDLFQNRLWELEDKIERYKDDADRRHLEIIAMRKRIIKLVTRIEYLNAKIRKITKKSVTKLIRIRKGSKVDNFLTKNLVKYKTTSNNFPERNYHYRLINDKDEAIIINDDKLLKAILNAVSPKEIRSGTVLRIKRSGNNRYYVWVKKR